MPSHVVIGGGITGLAACWYLAKAGHRPVLVEKERRLGGVIRTDQVEGCLIEGGPDSFLSSKPAAMELIRELGLEADVIGSNDHQRITSIVKNGRLVPMPDGLMMMVPTRIGPVVKSPLLSWGTKIRMGLEYFRGPRADAPERSVAQFIREHYGQEAVDYLAEPLLSGVYGGDPEEMSADSVLEMFVNFEKKYGSLTKGTLAMRAERAKQGQSGPLFRTLKGGMEQLTQAITYQLAGKIERYQDEAIAVRKSSFGYEIELKRDKLYAENVFVCCPATAAAQILKPADERISELLAGIRYNSSVTLALGYEQPDVEGRITGFGFLVPKVERKRMAACTYVKTKFDHRVPPAKAVLRCFLGGAAIDVPEGDLIRDVLAELKELIGLNAVPLFTRVTRWHGAMAQYGLGHKARIREIRERAAAHPGLHLAGNAYDGIGIPDCIRGGKAVAGL
ncbi:MAG TPA: protoporphyrinogen oxidase [Bryobacteraceae bacterium]|nr:protoporphyrinogen oxidase [Bryobacteraceae bacterium]